MLFPVQFIDQFGNGSPAFGICIMLVDAFLVGLLDRDNRIPRKILKLPQDFLGHFPDTVLNKSRILVRGKDDCPLVSPLKELIDTTAHRILEDTDDLFQVNMLVIVSLDAQETLAALVVGSHGHCREEFIDLILSNIKTFQYPHGTFFHDVLGAGACRHPGYFSTNALPYDRTAERTPGDCPCMDLDNFVTCRMTDRGLALYHEFAAHEHFCPVCIFMAVEQFSCNNAAEFLDLVDFTVDCLLEYFIDHFEIPGKVCTLETPRKIDVHIEIGNKNDRPFFTAVNFDEFFYIFNPYPGKINTDIRRRSLDIRQFPVE